VKRADVWIGARMAEHVADSKRGCLGYWRNPLDGERPFLLI